MKDKIKHISLLLLFLFGTISFNFAQNMTLVVPSNLALNSEVYQLQLNDDIEFYYDSIGVKFKLLTSQTWQGNELTFVLPGDTPSAQKTGYSLGENIYLRIFDKSNNCRKEAISVFTTLDNSGAFQFINNVTDTIKTINLTTNRFIYSLDSLCSGKSVLSISGNMIDFLAPLPVFSSIPNGINFDTNGDILHQNSTPGNYKILLDYHACIEKNGELEITILPPLVIQNSDVLITNNECGMSNGSIEVVSSQIFSPSTYIFNLLGSEIYQGDLAKVENLSEGIYDILITDKYACTAAFSATLICKPLTKTYVDISSGDYILSNLKAETEKIEFNCDKEIKIANSAGRIVKTLQANKIWIGDDFDGAELPTGVYIVYCDDSRLGEVTIIR